MSDPQYDDVKTMHTLRMIGWLSVAVIVLLFVGWLAIKAYLWFAEEDIIEQHSAKEQAEAIKADRKRNATFDLQTQAIDDYIAEQIEIPVEGETDHEIITTIIDRFPCAVDRSLSKACPPDGIRLPD